MKSSCFLLVCLIGVCLPQIRCLCEDEYPVWFVQLTDTHLSHLGYMDRYNDLKRFVKNHLALINPSFVIHTGDITDGILKSGAGGQSEDEWKDYSSIISLYYSNPTHPKRSWYDVRGNHDVFAVQNWNSSKNYYSKHNGQGLTADAAVRQFVIRPDKTNKQFVVTLIDTTQKPGLGRMLNFFGMIENKDILMLKEAVQKAKQLSVSGPPVFAGHHPFAYVSTSGSSTFLEMLSVGAYYLCGHLHTVNNWANRMYYKHNNELVELELGDWKVNRRYRIGVWDQGRFSFADYELTHEVAVVVLNPQMPGLSIVEPSTSPLNRSFQIRILAFSLISYPIRGISIKLSEAVDYYSPCIPCKNAKSNSIPLWTLSLHQLDESYITSLHDWIIRIELINGRTYEQRYTACLHQCDDFRYGFTAWVALNFVNPRILLFVYLLLLSTHILALVHCRFNNHHRRGSTLSDCKVSRITRSCFCALSCLCFIDVVFYSLLFDDIYSIVGPWMVGHLTEGTYGASFVWGTVVQNSIIQADVQLLSAIAQIVLVHWPFTIALSLLLKLRLKQQCKRRLNRRMQGGEMLLFVTCLAICIVPIILSIFNLVTNSRSFPYLLAFSHLTAFSPWLKILLTLYILFSSLSQISAQSIDELSSKNC